MWHFFDLSFVQGWVFHKMFLEDEAMSLENFKISVANALMLDGKVNQKQKVQGLQAFAFPFETAYDEHAKSRFKKKLRGQI